jgi:hypothetical protein
MCSGCPIPAIKQILLADSFSCYGMPLRHRFVQSIPCRCKPACCQDYLHTCVTAPAAIAALIAAAAAVPLPLLLFLPPPPLPPPLPMLLLLLLSPPGPAWSPWLPCLMCPHPLLPSCCSSTLPWPPSPPT